MQSMAQTIARRDIDPDTVGRATTSVEVGRLVYGAFQDVLAYGRALGLDVQFHRGGGVLAVHGYVVARGRWVDMRRFLIALSNLIEATGE